MVPQDGEQTDAIVRVKVDGQVQKEPVARKPEDSAQREEEVRQGWSGGLDSDAKPVPSQP